MECLEAFLIYIGLTLTTSYVMVALLIIVTSFLVGLSV